MKKKRIFYLDFIRAFSMILIVAYHFNIRIDILSVSNMNFLLDNNSFSFGIVGVRLFFIISGVSLMYNYKDKINIKSFYKKRFFNIYPMYWLAYSGAFIVYYLILKNPVPKAPIISFIFTILGVDNYIMDFMPTFYLLGEWFLGVIIAYYLIFPILRKCIIRAPEATLGVLLIIALAITFFNPFSFKPPHRSILVSMFSCGLGMVLVQKKWEPKAIGAVISLLVILGLIIFKPVIDVLFVSHILALAMFYFLVYISKYIQDNNIVRFITDKLGKYSYGIFLVHHVVLIALLMPFANKQFSAIIVVCLFIVIFTIVLVIAMILSYINNLIMKKMGIL